MHTSYNNNTTHLNHVHIVGTISHSQCKRARHSVLNESHLQQWRNTRGARELLRHYKQPFHTRMLAAFCLPASPFDLVAPCSK